MWTYGVDWAYSLVYFCCSAGSNKPSLNRDTASSFDNARFFDSGCPLVSVVLRFMLRVDKAEFVDLRIYICQR